MTRAGLRLRIVAVVLAGLAVSIAIAAALYRVGSERDLQAFEADARAAEDAIMDRIETSIALLRGTAGLFASHGAAVTVQSFRAYADRVALREQYPGLLGIGFTLRMDLSQRAAVEAAMREQGHADFRIWPDLPREELHSILFLEPLDRRNRAAIGYDMFTQSTRRAAMERARDEGRAAASGIVELVQEIDEVKQPGFLIYLPVYRGGAAPPDVATRRERLVGFAYAPIRAGDFLSSAFSHEALPQVGVAVYHGEAARPERLLYRHGLPAASRSRFTSVSTVQVAGQPWTLEFRSTGTLAEPLLTPFFVLLAGVALSAVLGVLLWREAASRAAIESALERERGAQRELALVTESMAAPVVRCTSDWRFVWANAAYARWLGRSPQDLIGRTIPEVLGPTETEALRPYIERVLSGEALRYERRAAYAGAGVRWVSVAYTPLREGSGPVTGWVAVVTDITERKLFEQELLDASRQKDEFLATLAHELRNPLAPIRNGLHLLRMLPPTDPSAQASRQMIERQVDHMVRLVDDLLDVSRITTGKLALRREPVDLRAVAGTALEAAEAAMRARQHTLQVALPGAPAWVNVDATRLSQVFLNLLNNAAKFTPPGGRIHFHAGLEGDALIARVRDNGAGIAPGEIESIFGMFNQVGRTPEGTPAGLGVGLALSQRLVELHGGTIEARSEGEGRGAEFVVRIPRAAAEAPAARS